MAMPALISDASAVTACVLYSLNLRIIPSRNIGPHGLVPALPTPILIATGLLIVAISIALTANKLVFMRLRIYLLALIFFLYATPAIVYREARYSWLYKTVGVIQYVNAHGALDRSIDIYQNWPGFFAIAAWFDKVAGIRTPLIYAKWAQFTFEVLTAVVLAFALRSTPLTHRERWTAIFLFFATNWIAQDYLSPQALATVLSLGVLGIALHWLVLPDKTNRLGSFLERSARWIHLERFAKKCSRLPSDTTAIDPTSRRYTALAPAALLVVYFVIVFTHELSPYIVLIQLGGLALIGKFRPSWTTVGMLVLAVAYLIPRFTFINQHFGIVASIGNFFGNVLPPSRYVGHLSAAAQLDQHGADALSLLIWLSAALGAYLRWRRGRPIAILGLLAVLPVVVLVAGAYGTEGVLRVYLFSLPWCSALTASAFWELASLVPWRRSLQMAAALCCCVCLFSLAFFGNDMVYVMPTTEVQAFQEFYRIAAPGPVYQVNDNFPGLVSGRYNLFPQYYLLGQYGILPTRALHADSGALVAEALSRIHATYNHPAYLVLAPTVEQYGAAFGTLPPREYETLRRSLLRDPQWKPIINRDGILIESLPKSVFFPR